MRNLRFLLIALSICLLSSPLVFCQTETSKAETKQKDTATDEGKKTVPSQQPSRSAPTSVPKVELTNARITFDHTVFDFGSIPKGTKVSHDFWFENTGTDTLVITRVKPT
jgi:hypothetical protein